MLHFFFYLPESYRLGEKTVHGRNTQIKDLVLKSLFLLELKGIFDGVMVYAHTMLSVLLGTCVKDESHIG